VDSHVVLAGGEPFSEPRHIWWNFVSSSKDRIEQAKDDWRSGRFARIPGDDKEFIPLPE
jgi:redox-sensitive bicupin YhaK (pirin superfamily)